MLQQNFNHRAIITALYDRNAPAEHRMVNPAVDPVPPINHRVITTVLGGAVPPRLEKSHHRNRAITRAGF